LKQAGSHGAVVGVSYHSFTVSFNEENGMKRTSSTLTLLAGFLMATAIAVMTGTAEAQPALQAGDDDNCIACHTDKETLQALAVEPEEAEELSEGEG
jgi:hypothetical protein